MQIMALHTVGIAFEIPLRDSMKSEMLPEPFSIKSKSKISCYYTGCVQI